MGEKTFSIEARKDRPDYKVQILNIINDIERRVRAIKPDTLLHKELHEKKMVDSRREMVEFEKVRQDICESFGIDTDQDHTFFYPTSSDIAMSEQRALRAFFVLIDTLRQEGFYGEGRTDHNTLFRKLAELARKNDPNLTFESVVGSLDSDPPGYLVFKGFMSIKDFREISEASRRVLETPVLDSDGQPIHTAEDWFISGHSLKETQEDSNNQEGKPQ